MAKYDWKEIKRRYITGGDEVSHASLCEEFGIPHRSQLSKRATSEDWSKQRQLYRERTHIPTIRKEHDLLEEQKVFDRVVHAETRVNQLIDEVETLTRHINIAKILYSKGLEGVKATDPNALKPNEIVNLIKLGTDIERQAMGLAAESADLDSMSKEELEAIANGQTKPKS